MHASLNSLLRDPHRNLRIFIDSNAVHDESSNLSPDELNRLLFPGNPTSANIQTFISAVLIIHLFNFDGLQ
jgi:hypothetical protein